MSNRKSLLVRVIALLGFAGYLCISYVSARRKHLGSQMEPKPPLASDESSSQGVKSDSEAKVTGVKSPTRLPRQQRVNWIEEAILGGPEPRRPRAPKVEGLGFWKRFRGNDSPASVAFGCTSLITTLILVSATILLAKSSNNLLGQQNELMRASSQPDISASLILTGSGGFTLTVENSGPRANFRSIQPITLLRFTFENFNSGIEHGYVALYDVFPESEPNRSGTGQLISISSVPGLATRSDEICALVVSADERIQECALEIALVIRYQTNTDDVFSNYYRFDGEASYLVSAGEVEKLSSRWDDNPNDKTGFSIASYPPDGMVGWVDEYVDHLADDPAILNPFSPP